MPGTDTSTLTPTPAGEVHDVVRAHYAEAAIAASRGSTDSVAQGSCCDDAGTPIYGSLLYPDDDRSALPDAAVLASLGCGNPTAVAELRPGETVLDLGSGGGIDVLLSARRVGPTGRAIGIDMTDEMLELARRNAAEAGAPNVEFRKGTIENLPVADDSVDVVISNCVINLAADKAAVMSEIARVLRPGGRVGVSDVVADDGLTPAELALRGSYGDCIAGALTFGQYTAGLTAAGLTDVEVVPTHRVGDGLHAAIIRARKPEGWRAAPREAVAAAVPDPATTRSLAMLDTGSCGPGCC